MYPDQVSSRTELTVTSKHQVLIIGYERLRSVMYVYSIILGISLVLVLTFYSLLQSSAMTSDIAGKSLEASYTITHR
jgi:hypothetical protein